MHFINSYTGVLNSLLANQKLMLKPLQISKSWKEECVKLNIISWLTSKESTCMLQYGCAPYMYLLNSIKWHTFVTCLFLFLPAEWSGVRLVVLSWTSMVAPCSNKVSTHSPCPCRQARSSMVRPVQTTHTYSTGLHKINYCSFIYHYKYMYRKSYILLITVTNQ